MNQHESRDRDAAGGVLDRPLGPEAQALDWSQVLARIPDVKGRVNRNSSRKRSSGKRQKRLVSPAMSVKILMAGGAVLLACAVFPFLFGSGDSDDSTSSELSADAVVAPRWESSQTTPTGPVEVAAGREQSGMLPGGALSPRAFPSANTGPAANSGRSGALMPSSMAADYRPGDTSRYPTAGSANANRPPTADVNRPMEIGDPRSTAEAGNRTADRRAGLPVAPIQASAIEASAWPRREPAAVKASYRPGSTTSYPAPNTATRQPAPDTAASYPTSHTTTRYPATDRYHQPASQPSRSVPQPGVARFEGVIEKPIIRTTDERARPSFH